MNIHLTLFTPCGGYVQDDEAGFIFHSLEQLRGFVGDRMNQVGLPTDPVSGPAESSSFQGARVPPKLSSALIAAASLLSRDPTLMMKFYPGWMPPGTPSKIERLLQALPESHYKGYFGSIFIESGLVWLCWRDGRHDRAVFVSSAEGMRQAVDVVHPPPNLRAELLENADRCLPPTSPWANSELVGPMATLLVIHMEHVYRQARKRFAPH